MPYNFDDITRGLFGFLKARNTEEEIETTLKLANIMTSVKGVAFADFSCERRYLLSVLRGNDLENSTAHTLYGNLLCYASRHNQIELYNDILRVLIKTGRYDISYFEDFYRVLHDDRVETFAMNLTTLNALIAKALVDPNTRDFFANKMFATYEKMLDQFISRLQDWDYHHIRLLNVILSLLLRYKDATAMLDKVIKAVVKNERFSEYIAECQEQDFAALVKHLLKKSRIERLEHIASHQLSFEKKFIFMDILTEHVDFATSIALKSIHEKLQDKTAKLFESSVNPNDLDEELLALDVIHFQEIMGGSILSKKFYLTQLKCEIDKMIEAAKDPMREIVIRPAFVMSCQHAFSTKEYLATIKRLFAEYQKLIKGKPIKHQRKDLTDVESLVLGVVIGYLRRGESYQDIRKPLRAFIQQLSNYSRQTSELGPLLSYIPKEDIPDKLQTMEPFCGPSHISESRIPAFYELEQNTSEFDWAWLNYANVDLPTIAALPPWPTGSVAPFLVVVSSSMPAVVDKIRYVNGYDDLYQSVCRGFHSPRAVDEFMLKHQVAIFQLTCIMGSDVFAFLLSQDYLTVLRHTSKMLHVNTINALKQFYEKHHAEQTQDKFFPLMTTLLRFAGKAQADFLDNVLFSLIISKLDKPMSDVKSYCERLIRQSTSFEQRIEVANNHQPEERQANLHRILEPTRVALPLLVKMMGLDAYDFLVSKFSESADEYYRFIINVYPLPKEFAKPLKACYEQHRTEWLKNPKLWSDLLTIAQVCSHNIVLTDALQKGLLAMQETRHSSLGQINNFFNDFFKNICKTYLNLRLTDKVLKQFLKTHDLSSLLPKIVAAYERTRVDPDKKIVFQEMLSAWINPKGDAFDQLMHNTRQGKIGHAIATHNNNIRTDLQNKGINTELAYHYPNVTRFTTDVNAHADTNVLYLAIWDDVEHLAAAIKVVAEPSVQLQNLSKLIEKYMQQMQRGKYDIEPLAIGSAEKPLTERLRKGAVTDFVVQLKSNASLEFLEKIGQRCQSLLDTGKLSQFSQVEEFTRHFYERLTAINENFDAPLLELHEYIKTIPASITTANLPEEKAAHLQQALDHLTLVDDGALKLMQQKDVAGFKKRSEYLQHASALAKTIKKVVVDHPNESIAIVGKSLTAKLNSIHGSKMATRLEPKSFRVEMWNKNDIRTFYLGDLVSCCLATDNRFNDMLDRILDDALLFPVVIDEEINEPIALVWLLFAEESAVTEVKPVPKNADQYQRHFVVEKLTDTPVYCVSNFMEIRTAYGTKPALRDRIVAQMIQFVAQYTQNIGAEDFLMRPLTYGLIRPAFTGFEKSQPMTIAKVGDYFNYPGLTEKNAEQYTKAGAKYYLDAVTMEPMVFDRYTPEGFAKQFKDVVQVKQLSVDYGRLFKAPKLPRDNETQPTQVSSAQVSAHKSKNKSQ